MPPSESRFTPARELDAPGRDLQLTLERFDYTRVGEHLAVLQVLARPDAGAIPPASATVLAHCGHEMSLRFPAQACHYERRLLSGGDTELLWRVLFTVPLALTQRPGPLFELSVDGVDPLTLPVPEVRDPGLGALELAPAIAGESLRVPGAGLRQAVA
ncbi:MAG: hypothetical protein M3016_08000, partial [Actinomycetota bacterium]|nr:hypothetical protein [Actinomycetota bacterium]